MTTVAFHHNYVCYRKQDCKHKPVGNKAYMYITNTVHRIMAFLPICRFAPWLIRPLDCSARHQYTTVSTV